MPGLHREQVAGSPSHLLPRGAVWHSGGAQLPPCSSPTAGPPLLGPPAGISSESSRCAAELPQPAWDPPAPPGNGKLSNQMDFHSREPGRSLSSRNAF